ncbi:MAG: hypothetical protein Q9227_002656 [Pyrenula ochraceoflavens]
MKTASLLTLSASLLSSTASAYWKGFNVGANNADGSCKTKDQWQADFVAMANLPGHFTSARLYASSDCNTLANAVPAAIATGTTLLVGLWAEDGNHYNAEKQALLQAIQTYGKDWIIAVSVGSEDLYRGDTDANTLVSQINDVRGMLWGLGASDKEVTHVDTWTAWVDPANAAVISAVDFLGMDGYPYFQNASIDDAWNVFWKSVDDTRNVSQGKWVWITETGWPYKGENYGPAEPSIGNAQAYFTSTGCQAFDEAHTFMYTLSDYEAATSFGVLDENRNPLYDITCHF